LDRWELVPRPEQGIVLEHALPHVRLRPSLNLDVDENELWFSVTRTELGDDVGLAPSSVVQVRENFGVEELDVFEVESLPDMGIEQLQEILQKCVQEFLEALVVSHFPSSTDK